MNSKRKVIVTFGIMIAVILALVTTLVVVLAFTQQTIRTSLNIGYTAIDVDGSVQATYTIGNTTNYLQRSDGLGNKITFDASDTSDQNVSLVFPTNEIKLTSTNKSILLTYMFTNTGGNVYTAIMSLSGLSSENMTLEYSLDNQTFNDSQYALVVRNTGISYYYVRITVTDVAHNASFSGDLSWTLENYEPTGEEANIPVTQTSYSENTDGTYTATYNGSALTGNTLIVPSNVGSIEVTKFKIPADINMMGESNPYKLPANTKLVISEGIKEIITIDNMSGQSTNGLVSVSIPASVTVISENGAAAYFPSANLAEIKVAEGNTVYSSAGNCLIEKASKTLLVGALGCEIPRDGSVTIIKTRAFYNRNIPYLYIPASVETIAEWAVFPYNFKCTVYCEAESKPSGWLTSTLAPDNGKTTLKYGYSYAKYLQIKTLSEQNPDFKFDKATTGIAVTGYTGSATEITIPYGVTEIGENAFSINNIGFSAPNLTKVTIPGSVKTIGPYAFNGSSLSEVVIENGVETIQQSAFASCSNLATLWIPDSVTTIVDGGPPTFLYTTVVYCEALSKPDGWNLTLSIDPTYGVTEFKYGYTYEQYLSAIAG